jgi:hypothetical protein
VELYHEEWVVFDRWTGQQVDSRLIESKGECPWSVTKNTKRNPRTGEEKSTVHVPWVGPDSIEIRTWREGLLLGGANAAYPSPEVTDTLTCRYGVSRDPRLESAPSPQKPVEWLQG